MARDTVYRGQIVSADPALLMGGQLHICILVQL